MLAYPIEVDADLLTWVMTRREEQQPITVELLQAQGMKHFSPHTAMQASKLCVVGCNTS